ncbi:hypothetical protein SAMN05421763_11714 [[Luteovulum] sphaeroides subsp. megalophilum]|uniref:hypothetical protein n=1 Tax=Cereibacter sphaeroides TaxID=1063 RepID=UPI000B6E0B3A|nr:hypothetical protein [Cereibacter sphaeroides]SNT42160.1 hypothetical protein SAMN05421763_11714 [[Luteovulum] sphaeroides subsp. megalophilum]
MGAEPVLRLVTASAIVIAGLTGLILFLSASIERSYSIAARTLGGELTFKGQSNDWLLEKVDICKMRGPEDMRLPAAGDDRRCPETLYEVLPQAETVLHWPPDTRIGIRHEASGDLIFIVLSANVPDLPEGSLIVIPAEAWQTHGALAFQAEVRIGGLMATGSEDYLMEGRWEARQSGIAASLRANVAEVVGSGALSLGTTVELIDTRDTAAGIVSFGHVTPTVSRDERGFDIELLSERGSVALRVWHFGLQEPTIFRPDWMDVVSSSPILVALGPLVALVAGLVELMVKVRAGGRPVPAPPAPDPSVPGTGQSVRLHKSGKSKTGQNSAARPYRKTSSGLARRRRSSP